MHNWNNIVQTKITQENIWALKQMHNLGYRSALIGGGAVRDTYFGKEINDIDIFFWYPQYSDETIESQHVRLDNNVEELEDIFGLNMESHSEEDNLFMLEDDYRITYIDNGSDDITYGSAHIQCILEFEKNEVSYQLIGLKVPPLEYITRYLDVDLCRCWCDGTRMRYPGGFTTDAKNRTITLNGDLTEAEYLYALTHHIPRITYKYPNFTVVDLLRHKYTP